jgi:hypothetical protein
MTATVLHILSPFSSRTAGSLVRENTATEGDLIAAFAQFPFIIYEVGTDKVCREVTSDLITVPDYWTVVREWLKEFTRRTHVQDLLSVEGYSLWWALSYAKCDPGLSEFANSFVWVDLLKAAQKDAQPESVIIYGDHEPIMHIAQQLFPKRSIRLKNEQARLDASRRTRQSPLVPGQFALVVARIGLSLLYLIYLALRNPAVCFFSTANSLRSRSVAGKQELFDVYYGDLAHTLEARGWKIAFVEQFAQNASWKGLRARGFFFPSDLILALSHPRLSWLLGHRKIVKKWQNHWAESRITLAAHTTYQGFDIMPAVYPLLHDAFSGAAHIESGVQLWKRVLRYWHPRLLYIDCSYCKLVVPVIIAAKILGIQTVEQQHGVIAKNHLAYHVPEHLRLRSQLPLCDFLVAWGDYVKRLLVGSGVYSEHQIIVCGFPRLDSLLKSCASREVTYSRLDLPATAQVVLYASNGIVQDLYSDILDSLQEADDALIFWIIKLHPREKTRHVWESEIRKRQLKRVIIIEDELDFYALLAVSDMHVSFCSTTMIEAAVFGKPNLGLDIPAAHDPIGYAEADAYLPVEPRQLGEIASNILQDRSKVANLMSQQGAFARDWCRHDGKAIECILHFIESRMLVESSQKHFSRLEKDYPNV